MNIRPPAKYSASQDFLKAYQEAKDHMVSSKADTQRLLHLRCSQLPFCGASLLIDYMMGGTTRSLNMQGAFYTKVGTVVHTVMQTFLPKTGTILGDYVCHECGTVYRMSSKHECCDFDTEYHEVSIDCGGIQGHIDGIFRDSQGNYWIIDFKTTKVALAEHKQQDPGDAYKEQVEAYAFLLKRQYGITVKGCMLIFIKRDDPGVPVIWMHEVDENRLDVIKRRLIKYRAWHKAAINATTIEEVMEVASHKCSDPYCKYCKMDQAALLKVVTAAFQRQRGKLPLAKLWVPPKNEVVITVAHGNPMHKPQRIYLKSAKDFSTEPVFKAIKKLRHLQHRLEVQDGTDD